MGTPPSPPPRFTAALTATLALGAACQCPAMLQDAATPSSPGNVLLLILDDVGANEVGVYGVGESPPFTPRMDALAAEGVRFTRA